MKIKLDALKLNLSESGINQLSLKERKAFLMTLMNVTLESSPDLQKIWQMEIDTVNESYGISKGESNERN